MGPSGLLAASAVCTCLAVVSYLAENHLYLPSFSAYEQNHIHHHETYNPPPAEPPSPPPKPVPQPVVTSAIVEQPNTPEPEDAAPIIRYKDSPRPTLADQNARHVELNPPPGTRDEPAYVNEPGYVPPEETKKKSPKAVLDKIFTTKEYCENVRDSVYPPVIPADKKNCIEALALAERTGMDFYRTFKDVERNQ